MGQRQETKPKPSSANETLMSDLSLLVRARYPFIYIISHEEERVISALEQLGKGQQRPVFVWSTTRGLHPSHSENEPSRSSTSIIDGLSDIRRYKGAALFVVLDAHRLLEASDITRQLADLRVHVEQESKTVFFLGGREGNRRYDTLP